jgi:hypothetical protein
MDLKCINDWENYHKNRKIKQIDFKIDTKIKTWEDHKIEMEFKIKQTLILAFCDPTTHESFYLHEHEKWHIINGKRYDDKEINFKDNWDLLMYAVERIEGMGYFSTIEKFKDVNTHRMWFNECETFAEYGSGAREETKKETIYEAVLDFCETYVKNNLDKILENGGKI